jgi:hypothetical protein
MNVEVTVVMHPRAWGIYSNSHFFSPVRQLVQIYSTDVPASRGVVFWTNMIHLSVEGAAVVHPRALVIYLNSPPPHKGSQFKYILQTCQHHRGYSYGLL